MATGWVWHNIDGVWAWMHLDTGTDPDVGGGSTSGGGKPLHAPPGYLWEEGHFVWDPDLDYTGLPVPIDVYGETCMFYGENPRGSGVGGFIWVPNNP